MDWPARTYNGCERTHRIWYQWVVGDPGAVVKYLGIVLYHIEVNTISVLTTSASEFRVDMLKTSQLC